MASDLQSREHACCAHASSWWLTLRQATRCMATAVLKLLSSPASMPCLACSPGHNAPGHLGAGSKSRDFMAAFGGCAELDKAFCLQTCHSLTNASPASLSLLARSICWRQRRAGALAPIGSRSRRSLLAGSFKGVRQHGVMSCRAQFHRAPCAAARRPASLFTRCEFKDGPAEPRN